MYCLLCDNKLHRMNRAVVAEKTLHITRIATFQVKVVVHPEVCNGTNYNSGENLMLFL